MKLKRFSVLFGFIASVAIFSSCRQDLLESPSFYTRGSYSKGTIVSPEKVSATQGGYRSITLTWSSSKSAKNYEIWSSETATGEFKKIGETSDSTCSYTSGDAPGVLKYFRIKAVDYNDAVSEFSTTCFGTTLATPAITWVKQNANGDAITVKWYKGANCTQNTYLNDGLFYTVILWNSDATKVLKEVTISAEKLTKDSETMYTFTDLEPNTVYNVQVKAYTKLDQNQTENSDPENQSTAHSLIPAAPENFTVEKGTSKEQIKLSWTLPKFAETKVSSAYETRPVYFKILRKLESAPDKDYETIVSYLGAIKQTSTSASVIYFEKKSEANPDEPNSTVTPAAAPVSVEYLAEQTETDANYPNYVPGTKITYSDKTAEVGKKYSYRIQSYIDDNGNKLITSDESYSDECGWLINSPTVSVSSTYKKNAEDENKIDSFTVTLDLKFDDFGQPYNYIIEETCQVFEKTEGEDEFKLKDGYPQYKYFCGKISMFPKVFDPYIPEDSENLYKKYSYKVYICDSLSEEKESAYIVVEPSGSILVINDVNKKPNVEDFSVEDGYKDKFLLSWTYNNDCKYTLKWKNNDDFSFTTEELDNSVLEKNLNEETGKVTFEHSANSGDIRKNYTLIANNGLESSKPLDDEYKTLGIPKPDFEPSYKSIKIIWNPVQKAQKYEIKAIYNEKDIDSESISSIQTDENGNLYCEITEPYGKTDETFNTTDAEISGQKIDFSITAISENPNAEPTVSSDDFKIFTLGPGAIEHTKQDNGIAKTVKGLLVEGTTDKITLKWKKVENANGYLIVRKKYSEDYYSDIKNKADVYYYSEETKKLSLKDADATIQASCNETAGEFTFKDNYKKAENYDNQYEVDQAQLKWGFPYGYTVIPVLKDTDFEIDELNINGTAESITYRPETLNKVEQKGATTGYGLALNASKATSTTTVSLSWKAPYKTEQKPTIYYRHYKEENGSKWKKLGISNSLDTAQVKPEDNYKAYDYMVCYSQNSPETIELDSFFEDYIAKKTDSNNEKDNKGYILALEAPTAKYGGNPSGDDYKKDKYYYSENLSWKQYDTEEKKQGFDKAEIFMLNTNKKDGWIKIVELDPTKLVVKNTDVADSKYDLLIEKSTDTDITLMPKSIIDGGTNTNGLLKVLRDAKHYYRIVASRSFIDSEDKNQNPEISIGDEGSIYAYRQITDEELVKSTMLVIADAFNKTSQGNTTKGAEGTFWWDANYSWDFDAWYKLKMSINNYIVSWSKLPYSSLTIIPLPSFMKVLLPTESNAIIGRASEHKPSFLCTGGKKDFNISGLIPLTIEKTNIPLSSYSGTVKFATSDTKFSVTVEHNGSQTFNKDVSGDEVKRWFPAKIGNNEYIGDSAEYWWE